MLKKSKKRKANKKQGKNLLIFGTTKGKSRKGRWKNSSTPAKRECFRSSSNVVS